MKLFHILIGLLCGLNVHAQKPQIDSMAIRSWPELRDPVISNDGDLVCYRIDNQPIGLSTLVIKVVNDNWKKEEVGAELMGMAADGKRYAFKRNDTLFLAEAGSDRQTNIPKIASIKGQGNFIAYQLVNNKQLFLLDVTTGKSQAYEQVNNYVFNTNGTALLLIREMEQGAIAKNELLWIDLAAATSTTFYSEEKAKSKLFSVGYFRFNKDGNQVTFLVQEKNDARFGNTVWYFKQGMPKAIVCAKDGYAGIENGFKINQYPPQFSRSGRAVFFQLLKPAQPIAVNKNAVKVEVWSYRDTLLQTQQNSAGVAKTVNAAIAIDGNQVVPLEREDEVLVTYPDQVNGDYAVVSDNSSLINTWWKASNRMSFYLVSLKNGGRKLIGKGKLNNLARFSFSPNGKYLAYFDRGKKQYYAFNVDEDSARNISASIPVRLITEYNDEQPVNAAVAPVGMAGWLGTGSSLLIYDIYDIWKVDVSGKTKPVNITNGYGRLHNVKLRFLYEREAMYGISENFPLLLSGFSAVNKQNGIFKMTGFDKHDPELLSMGAYTIYHTSSQLPPASLELAGTMLPLKANNKDVWLLEKMSFDEFRNYYLTSDFKQLTALTDMQPQKKFSWLTAELVNYKELDGTTSQGILYKPENFDPKKKYPIIFNYYEKLSHRLYEFPKPGFSENTINIPWFVSRGYLVFTPDIHYKVGQVGPSVKNSVVGAANALSSKPWVDAARMAIQGHSFGGFETNYLVSHTNIFAAAVSAAGQADPISSYLSLDGPLGAPKGERQSVTEVNQGRYGASLWERPELYLQASAVLSADKINTPLLIMHNKADPSVPWGQGLQLFMSLRRLDKRVWMLSYDESAHSVFGKEAVDYTIRITQFFDHYLKGAAPPKWMTEGVPNNLKGAEMGYELDTTEACGSNCKDCKKVKNSNVVQGTVINKKKG